MNLKGIISYYRVREKEYRAIKKFTDAYCVGDFNEKFDNLFYTL